MRFPSSQTRGDTLTTLKLEKVEDGRDLLVAKTKPTRWPAIRTLVAVVSPPFNGSMAQRLNGSTAQRLNGSTAQRLNGSRTRQQDSYRFNLELGLKLRSEQDATITNRNVSRSILQRTFV